MFTRYTALKPSKTQFLQWITIFPNSYFSTTPARTPKRSSTRVRIATKKTKDYDSPIVKYWTIFARYVSNHLSDIFITVLYTLVLIAIFAERAYCKWWTLSAVLCSDSFLSCWVPNFTLFFSIVLHFKGSFYCTREWVESKNTYRASYSNLKNIQQLLTIEWSFSNSLYSF